MGNLRKIIHMIGDVIFIICPSVMMVSRKASCDDYITLDGLLVLGVFELICNARKL